MSGEVWKVVPSAPWFLVSSEGRIMVAPYEADMPHGGKRQYGGHPSFGVWSNTDSRFIIVYKGKTYKIAPLICEAFSGSKPFPDAVCMHLDENSANNKPDNLEWGTQKQNLNAPGYIAGLKARMRSLSDDQIVDILKRRQSGEELTSIAATYNVRFQTISEIVHGRIYSDVAPEFR